MKTIKGVDERAQHFQEDYDEEKSGRLPSYRQMFKGAVGMFAATNREEALDCFQLGLKLRVDGNDLSLEDAEFKLLKQACDANPNRWTAHYWAQITMKLKAAEA